jgi:hypothetical protein
MQQRRPKAKTGKAHAGGTRPTIIDFPVHEQFRLYDMTEIASMMHVSHRFVKGIRDKGAPFIYGRTRPEWLHEWMREHAQEFRDEKICA